MIIKEIYPKWAILEVRYEGADVLFEKLLEKVKIESSVTCEKCGSKGFSCIVNSWKQVLCDLHYDVEKTNIKIKI